MGDIGIAVSQKGKDVQTTEDKNLLFSSAFQSLKIFNAYSVSTTIPASGTNTITINHNLGYFAPFVAIYNGSTSIGTTKSYTFTDSTGGIGLNTKQYTDKFELLVRDDFDDTVSSAGDTVEFTVYIFLDDFSSFAERNINSGTTTSTESEDYGFRISKENKDVLTADDLDLVASSSNYTHILHKKGIDTSGSSTVTVSHNLGYLPVAFAYTRFTSDTYIDFSLDLKISTSNISITTGGSTDVYYLIFKNEND